MAQKKTVKLQFEVFGVDEINEDGTSRQEVLKAFAHEVRVPVTFNRGDIKPNHAQIIEVMVDGKKVGELSDDDYIRYSTSIKSAKDAVIWIYEDELSDGSQHYTAVAVLVVPYAVSQEAGENLYGRKKSALIVCLIFFAGATLWALFHKDWFSVGIGVLICIGFGYWAFIRKPEQDDDVLYYYKTGKKKK